MTEVPREERCPYFACTACGLIGEPDSADYALTRDRGHVDWTRPMTVGCGFCRTHTQITNSDILDRDSEHACSRCGTCTACPADADRVICWGCGINEPGAASVGTRATYRQDVERGADQWATARVRVAKEDARARGALPGWAS